MHCPTTIELPQPPANNKGWPWTKETPQLPDSMPSGDPWPKITIVTPSFNQAKFIEKTIRSVLLQGYPDLEYIIIDGASTDNSAKIIKKYEKWLAYWVSEPDRGQSHAINKGFENSKGHILAWVNSDDYLLEEALKNVAIAYRQMPNAGGWFGTCLLTDEKGKVLQKFTPNRLDADALAGWGENAVGQPACFFSRAAWEHCGGLNERLYYCMDFELWIKLAKSFPIKKVDAVLAAAIVHKNAKTQTDFGQQYAVQFLVQIRHGYEEQAIRDMSRLIDVNFALNRKLASICRFPLFRPIAPIGRFVLKRLP